MTQILAKGPIAMSLEKEKPQPPRTDRPQPPGSAAQAPGRAGNAEAARIKKKVLEDLKERMGNWDKP